MSLAEQLEARVRERVRQGLGQVRISLAERIKERINSNTGQLAAGIMVDDWSENGSRYESTLRSLAPYSSYVDDGTGEFGPAGVPITSHSGGPLRFIWVNPKSSKGLAKDGYTYLMSVRGMPAQHFFKEKAPDDYHAACEDEF